MEIITGVSTAKEFVDAINDKGASLTNESTPEGLLEAINATGGNVTFNSTNGEIIESVNTPVVTLVDWDCDVLTSELIVYPSVEIPHTEEPYAHIYSLIEDTGGDGCPIFCGDEQIGDFSIGGGSSETSILAILSILPSASLPHSVSLNLEFQNYPDFDVYLLNNGRCTIDGVTKALVPDEINTIELPIEISYRVQGSIEDINLMLKKFIKIKG